MKKYFVQYLREDSNRRTWITPPHGGTNPYGTLRSARSIKKYMDKHNLTVNRILLQETTLKVIK